MRQPEEEFTHRKLPFSKSVRPQTAGLCDSFSDAFRLAESPHLSDSASTALEPVSLLRSQP